MPVVNELIRIEDDGTISFGDYKLTDKAKLDNFEYRGDLYKVKTCQEITKLERTDCLYTSQFREPLSAIFLWMIWLLNLAWRVTRMPR